MRSRKHRILTCTTALSSAMLLMAAPAAHAQDAETVADASASPASNDFGAIVVTAQRREQRLQDVPVAVAVVSGDSLEKQNITELNDMAVRVPNVSIATGTIANSITIRGVGSGQNAGFEQSVATFVDGVYRSRSRSTRAALFDLERVEVLKGPQLTFFGANAIAGALNIVTRKPGDELHVNGLVNYTPKTGGYDLQAGIDIPVSETVSFRLAGRGAGSDGYIENTNTGKDGPRDRTYQGRISMHYEPSATFRSDIRVDLMKSKTDGAATFQITDCPPSSDFTLSPFNSCRNYLNANGGEVDDTLDYTSAMGESFVDYKFIEVAWTNSLDIGNGTLTAISGYFGHENETLGQGIPFPLTNAVVGTDGFPTSQNETFTQISQEVRYQSETGGWLEYMFGGYASRGEIKLNTIVGFRFRPFGASDTTGNFNVTTPLAGNNFIDQTDRTLSGFASATIKPTDALRLNLGLRYANIHKEADRRAVPGISFSENPRDEFQYVTPEQTAIAAALLATNTDNFANPTRTDSRWMPSVGLQYDVAPDVMVYANFASGFKAGGYSFGANNEDFEPEKVKSYEIGLKGSFFDRRLALELAGYRSDYTNLQETTLQLQDNGTVASLVGNVAKSRSQGVEATASLRATPWFTLSSSIAYLDATYSNYEDGGCTILQLSQTPMGVSCGQSLSGERRPNAPEWSGNVGAHIEVPVGDFVVTADPLFYFTSGYFLTATADPLLAQEKYQKLDLRLGVGPDDGRWEVALIGKNLTNKVTSSFKQAVPLAPGSVSALVDAPRTIGIQLTVR